MSTNSASRNLDKNPLITGADPIIVAGNSMNKGAAQLLIAFLAVSSLIVVETAFAQSVPLPSVPEFILKYVNLSYDVPPTYGIDQYTGKTIITQGGYYVDNRSIQFTIKNQPFTPYTDANGIQIGLYYNFRVKGAYGTEWDYYPFFPDGQSSNTYGGPFTPLEQRPPAPAFSQSNAESTTVTITIPGVWRVPQGAPLDVQVQAMAGYMYYRDKQYHFVGQYGDWSSTQTITIGTSSSTPPPPGSPPPTSTPDQTTQPNQSTDSNSQPTPQTWQSAVILGAIVVVIVMVVVLRVYSHRRKR